MENCLPQKENLIISYFSYTFARIPLICVFLNMFCFYHYTDPSEDIAILYLQITIKKCKRNNGIWFRYQCRKISTAVRDQEIRCIYSIPLCFRLLPCTHHLSCCNYTIKPGQEYAIDGCWIVWAFIHHVRNYSHLHSSESLMSSPSVVSYKQKEGAGGLFYLGSPKLSGQKETHHQENTHDSFTTNGKGSFISRDREREPQTR